VDFPPSKQKISEWFVVFLGNNLIAWKSKKHVTVSSYSVEPEYRSMRCLVAELSWMSRLLHELTITSVTPRPVKCDNLAAIYIARNPVFYERTKHIEIDATLLDRSLWKG